MKTFKKIANSGEDQSIFGEKAGGKKERIRRGYFACLFSLAFLGLFHCSGGPSERDMKIYNLVSKGVVADGILEESYFTDWAPKGWYARYHFNNPADGKEYFGSCKGTAEHLSKLGNGDKIKIIFDHTDPNMNHE